MTPASPTTLYAAIRAVKAGDTIALAPGSYINPGWQSLATNPTYGIPAFDPANPVTVTSADPLNPAVFAGLGLTNVTGLAFSHIEVTPDARSGFCLSTSGGKGISFDHMHLHGAAAGGQAAMFRTSADVSITNSEIHGLGTGLNHLNCNGLTITGNNLHDFQVDAIRGGGSSNVTISGNAIHSLHPVATDHADAIQFWTNGGALGPASNLTISDNVITRGTGSSQVQGIFMGNESSLTYHNVTITGNAIDGMLYNGIALQLADNVKVADNFVHGWLDQQSWIYLTKVTNGVLSKNVATMVKADATNVGLVNTANITVPQGAVGDLAPLTTWQARNAVPPAPVVVPVDPRDATISTLQAQLLTVQASAQTAATSTAAQIADLRAQLSVAAASGVILTAANGDLSAQLATAQASLTVANAELATRGAALAAIAATAGAFASH